MSCKEQAYLAHIMGSNRSFAREEGRVGWGGVADNDKQGSH